MSGRRGFALLAVLWAVAVLSGAVLLAAADARLGIRTGGNRVALARAGWAAEGCLWAAFAQLDRAARRGAHLTAVAPVALAFARGVTCTAAGVDTTAGPDVTRAVVLRAWAAVQEHPPVATVEILVINAGRRAAVVRRRTW